MLPWQGARRSPSRAMTSRSSRSLCVMAADTHRDLVLAHGPGVVVDRLYTWGLRCVRKKHSAEETLMASCWRRSSSVSRRCPCCSSNAISLGNDGQVSFERRGGKETRRRANAQHCVRSRRAPVT